MAFIVCLCWFLALGMLFVAGGCNSYASCEPNIDGNTPGCHGFFSDTYSIIGMIILFLPFIVYGYKYLAYKIKENKTNTNYNSMV